MLPKMQIVQRWWENFDFSHVDFKKLAVSDLRYVGNISVHVIKIKETILKSDSLYLT